MDNNREYSPEMLESIGREIADEAIKDDWFKQQESQAVTTGLIPNEAVTVTPLSNSSDIEPEEEKEESFQIDPETDNPLSKINQEQLGRLMSQMRDMVGIMEMQWTNTRNEFGITDAHMRGVYNFNEEYRDPPPEGVEATDESYDRFNGINKLTDEQIIEIFGEEHPIIGVQLSQTIDRIKAAFTDFFQWSSALQEYRNVHDGYMELIEAEEEKNLEILRQKAEAHDNPEEREKALKSLDTYYANKYLDFLAEPLDERTFNNIIRAYSDERKIQYWIEKARRKMKQLKMSSKFILEISQFEKRFLDEKYHPQSNIFLLYFLNTTMNCDPYDNKNKSKMRVTCIVFGMDRFIRNKWSPAIRERILNNMNAFEDQFMDRIPKVESKPSEDNVYTFPKEDSGHFESPQNIEDMKDYNGGPQG